jgi:thiol-disulfide isomerase/thioredoxin
MKKYIALILLGFISFTSKAQLIADRTQYTCDNESENVFNVLKSNKILMICMQGLDCGGCRAGAPSVDTFATNHKNTIRVWGALNKINGTGTCTGVADWKTDFGYEDIFTFLDSSKYWEKTYNAEFLVINPKDFKVYYKSFDAASAIKKANELNDIIAGIIQPKATQIKVYPNPATSILNIDVDASIVTATITDVLGRSTTVSLDNKSINISEYKAGVYFLQLIDKSGNIFYSKFTKE